MFSLRSSRSTFFLLLRRSSPEPLVFRTTFCLPWEECVTVTRVLLQPLKVMDPDHPLAVLVQKAKQERTGAAAAAPPPEGALDPAAASTPTQQAADGE